MMGMWRRLSVQGKLVALVGALLTIVNVVGLFYASRMDRSMQERAERRATDVAVLIGMTAAPFVQAKDDHGLAAFMGRLSSLADVQFAAVRSADGALVLRPTRR